MRKSQKKIKLKKKVETKKKKVFKILEFEHQVNNL